MTQHAPRSHRLPNATVGQRYSHSVSASSLGGVSPPTDLAIPGLVFRFDSQQIHIEGAPLNAGDFSAQCAAASGAPLVFRLTVNPDPKSLWKTIEPSDTRYAKPHADSQYIRDPAHTHTHTHVHTASWSMAAASLRGRSHAHKGGFREDDFALRHCPDSGWNILVVADGAGSAPFSREGSRIAVNTAAECLGEKLNSELLSSELLSSELLNPELLNPEVLNPGTGTANITQSAFIQTLSSLFSHCAERVVEAIDQEAASQHCPSRDYATTLLVAAVKKIGDQHLVASYWIGDGAIAALTDERSLLLGRSDGGEYAGQTVFINARSIAAPSQSAFSCALLDDLRALVVMSDGVSDPKFETDSALESSEKWRDLWNELSPMLNDAQPDAQPDAALLKWLEFWAKGHHDDRTIALVWW